MPVTRWKIEVDGQTYGADGQSIIPATLADTVVQHAGEQRYTYYGKPYTLDPQDADSVYAYFDSEIDPTGRRLVPTVWEYQPGPEEAMTEQGITF